MKRLFTFAVIILTALIIAQPSFAQKKKKETKKERAERIANAIEDAVAKKSFFVAVTRLCPKSGVAQNVVYANDGFYVKIEDDKLTLNLPYIGGTERTSNMAYNNNDNLYLFADKQTVTVFGGWQAQSQNYRYRTIFWNNDDSNGTHPIQVVLTIQFNKKGEAVMMAEIENMEHMSYVGELIFEE